VIPHRAEGLTCKQQSVGRSAAGISKQFVGSGVKHEGGGFGFDLQSVGSGVSATVGATLRVGVGVGLGASVGVTVTMLGVRLGS